MEYDHRTTWLHPAPVRSHTEAMGALDARQDHRTATGRPPFRSRVATPRDRCPGTLPEVAFDLRHLGRRAMHLPPRTTQLDRQRAKSPLGSPTVLSLRRSRTPLAGTVGPQ